MAGHVVFVLLMRGGDAFLAVTFQVDRNLVDGRKLVLEPEKTGIGWSACFLQGQTSGLQERVLEYLRHERGVAVVRDNTLYYLSNAFLAAPSVECAI